MEPQRSPRPLWEIDTRLESLVGSPVRVLADLVIPKGWNGSAVPTEITSKNFILPDGSSVDLDPIYVEGVLARFERRVSVVWVELNLLPFEGTVEGRLIFRGFPAVILRGPAMVRLAHPFNVEMIPGDLEAYEMHLTQVDRQLLLKL